MRSFTLVVVVAALVGCSTTVEGPKPHACADAFAGAFHIDASRLGNKLVFGEDYPLCEGFPSTLSLDIKTNESLTTLVMTGEGGGTSTLDVGPEMKFVRDCDTLSAAVVEPIGSTTGKTSIQLFAPGGEVNDAIFDVILYGPGGANAGPICAAAYQGTPSR